MLALTKGRILKETLPLLALAGIEPLEPWEGSRKLLFPTTKEGVSLVILRGSDVPTFVQRGAADVGVVGKDVLMETNSISVYELLDLQIAKCRLMTAAPVAYQPPIHRRRVATKFVNVARHHYRGLGIQTDIIKLDGAMELAPLMGLADEIVDIVDTGGTLRAHGMEPQTTIAEISSRLIANKASMRTRHFEIMSLMRSLEECLNHGSRGKS